MYQKRNSNGSGRLNFAAMAVLLSASLHELVTGDTATGVMALAAAVAVWVTHRSDRRAGRA